MREGGGGASVRFTYRVGRVHMAKKCCKTGKPKSGLFFSKIKIGIRIVLFCDIPGLFARPL